MKLWSKIFLLSVIIITSACSSNKQLITLDREPNEAIVVGKLKVLYNDEDVTTKSRILFNELTKGEFSYKPDSTGYIITKLPVGEAFFSNIAYTNFSYKFQREDALFQLSNTNDVYYIGDIVVNWIGPKYKVVVVGLVPALLVSILDAITNDGDLELYVEDNQDAALEYFNNRFSTDLEFSNIVLDLPHPDSLSQHKSFAYAEENPNYIKFNLTKDRSCNGVLRMIKKKDIFVESIGENQNKLLYVFRRKNLISITDKDGNDITDTTLEETDFKRINFNKYTVIHY